MPQNDHLHPLAAGCSLTCSLRELLEPRGTYRGARIDFENALGITSLSTRGVLIASYQGGFTREQVIADLRAHALTHREAVTKVILDGLALWALPEGHRARLKSSEIEPQALTYLDFELLAPTPLGRSPLAGVLRVWLDRPTVRFWFRGSQTDLLSGPTGDDAKSLVSYPASLDFARLAFEEIQTASAN